MISAVIWILMHASNRVRMHLFKLSRFSWGYFSYSINVSVPCLSILDTSRSSFIIRGRSSGFEFTSPPWSSKNPNCGVIRLKTNSELVRKQQIWSIFSITKFLYCWYHCSLSILFCPDSTGTRNCFLLYRLWTPSYVFHWNIHVSSFQKL